MTPAPKRHWFAFSLRTLFVVLTLACYFTFRVPRDSYGAWRRVQERRATVRKLEAIVEQDMSEPPASRTHFLDDLQMNDSPPRPQPVP